MYTITDSKEHLRTVIIDKAAVKDKTKPQIKVEKTVKDSKKAKKNDGGNAEDVNQDNFKQAD